MTCKSPECKGQTIFCFLCGENITKNSSSHFPGSSKNKCNTVLQLEFENKSGNLFNNKDKIRNGKILFEQP